MYQQAQLVVIAAVSSSAKQIHKVFCFSVECLQFLADDVTLTKSNPALVLLSRLAGSESFAEQAYQAGRDRQVAKLSRHC